MAAIKKVDYDRIEADWRAGLLSPRQLAAKYTEETGIPVSHAAIISHFKKHGIERDLAEKIKAKADAMVTRAMVTGKVTREQTVPDVQIIEDGAVQVAIVRIGQRKDISRARNVANNLLAEIEGQTGPDAARLLADLGEMMRNPDDKGQDKLNDVYQKAASLPGRVKTMKELSDAMRILIGLEREAFSIGPGTDDPAGKPQKRVVLDFIEAVIK